MRMWCVPTNLLCRNHLLGEHKELHMIVGSVKKEKNLKGYIDSKFICFRQIERRHDQLVEEMKTRGYNHKSSLVFKSDEKIIIDKEQKIKNLKDLYCRCEKCRERIKEYKKKLEVK